jgi:tRNA threonylcarbamoyladenosine modification (KEOPS) complex  Pcc1 subunit
MHLLRIKTHLQSKKRCCQSKGKMKYTAQLTVTEDIDKIEKVFASEEREFSNKRAEYDIKREKSALIFNVKAKDATAFRAVLNSIGKVLAVYGKSKSAIGANDDE